MPLYEGFADDDYLLLIDIDVIPLACPYYWAHDTDRYSLYSDDYSYYTREGLHDPMRILFSGTGALAHTFRDILKQKPMNITGVFDDLQTRCDPDDKTCDEVMLGGLMHRWRLANETVWRHDRCT